MSRNDEHLSGTECDSMGVSEPECPRAAVHLAPRLRRSPWITTAGVRSECFDVAATLEMSGPKTRCDITQVMGKGGRTIVIAAQASRRRSRSSRRNVSERHLFRFEIFVNFNPGARSDDRGHTHGSKIQA
jgi:hypothetical protein